MTFCQVHPPRLVGREVLDDVAEDLGVRDEDADVVRRVELGRQDPDLLHLALRVAGLDDVAHREGTEDEEHDARGEVAQRPLERQPDGEAGRAQHGDEGGGLDAEEVEHRQADEDEQPVVDHPGDERDQHGVQARALQRAAGRLPAPLGGDPADRQQGEGAGQDGGRRGAVAGLVLLALGHLDEHLGRRVLDVHLLEDGHAVVRDDDVPRGVDEHLVHPLGAERRPDRAGDAPRREDVRASGVAPAGPLAGAAEDVDGLTACVGHNRGTDGHQRR